MSKITIEKFVAGEKESQFTVPSFALDVLSHVLPGSALGELKTHGIDVDAIAQAQKQGLPYTASTDVHEKGVLKTVVITVA